MNIQNLYGEPLTIYLYNYDSRGHQTYTDYLSAKQIKPMQLFFNKMLIFYKAGGKTGLLTPINNKNLNNNFTITISNQGIQQKIADINGSNITISTIIDDISYFYDQNCSTSVGNINDQICIDLEKILNYLNSYQINIINPENYTYWYVLYNLDEDNNVTSYAVNEVSDSFEYLQVVIYNDGIYYISGVLALLAYFNYYNQLDITLSLIPDGTYSVYTLSPQTYIENTEFEYTMYVTTDISNYINTGLVTLSLSDSINIDSTIFGLNVCLVIEEDLLMDYNLVSIDNNVPTSIVTYELSSGNYVTNMSGQYVFFFNFGYDNLYIYGYDGVKYNIFQFLSIQNNIHDLVVKIILEPKQIDQTDPEINVTMGDIVDSSLIYSITTTGNIINSLKGIKAEHFTFISDIDMTLYLYFYDTEKNYTTFTMSIKSMVPLPMYMAQKNLEMISYDTNNYYLYQFLSTVTNGVVITMDSKSNSVKTPVFVTAPQAIQLYTIDCNVQDYIYTNCNATSNYTKIGSPNNYICINNLQLTKDIFKSNFIIYSDQPLTLYILNFDNSSGEGFYVEMKQISINTYINPLQLSFTYRFLEIIYTLDEKIYGLFSRCDLTDVLVNGCIINLNLSQSPNKKTVKLTPGNNNIYYISNDISSFVNNINNFKACLTNGGTAIGTVVKFICVNQDAINDLTDTSNTISTSSDYTILIIVMLIIFSVIIIVFIIYMVLVRDNEKEVSEII